MSKLIKRLNKKGVSPIVAVVLLIALVVAAGAVIWLIVSGYLSQATDVSVTVTAQNLRYAQDDGNHNVYIVADISITVTGSLKIVIDNLYIKMDGYNYYFGAAQYGEVMDGKAETTGHVWSTSTSDAKEIVGSETLKDVFFVYMGNNPDATSFSNTPGWNFNTQSFTFHVNIIYHVEGQDKTLTYNEVTISTPIAKNY